MWAQTWEGLYDLLAPYPAAGTVDVTAEMVAQVNDKMEKCSSISLIIVHLFFFPQSEMGRDAHVQNSGRILHISRSSGNAHLLR